MESSRVAAEKVLFPWYVVESSRIAAEKVLTPW